MLSNNTEYIQTFAAPVRKLSIMVYVKHKDTDTTLVLLDKEEVKSITYERVGLEDRFYGYGICQKVNIKVMDKNREINPTTDYYIRLLIGTGDTVSQISPKLYISQVRRNEITNELSITAYDIIYQMAAHTTSELVDTMPPLNIHNYITEGLAVMGISNYNIIGDSTPTYTTYYTAANLEGTETIREYFDAIAETTQSIYYINNSDTLVFKQLDRDGEAVYTIDKEQYFTLDSGTNKRLAAITHTTELGDSITAKLAVSGTTQYIRDNPFYELRTDTHTLLDNALALMGGLTINQFECDWRGNPLVEIGDKIAIITKDGKTAYTYLLNDVLEYDGTMRQRTQWRYTDDTAETADNPTNLGEALYKTYAVVDKVEREIELVASNTASNTEEIAALRLNTNSIQASVSKTEAANNAAMGVINKDIAALTKKVEATITADDVRLEIQNEMANGSNKVITSTGFTFDDEGLRVSKTGTEMETVISEDGMTVFKDNSAVLVADNTGVVATNLHANTYLWIGTNSRIEDYNTSRTGVFWVG